MYIQWLQVSDFRNYRLLSYSPASTLNVLTGPNGQGKTNLLEGLGVLLAGRSFRGAPAPDLCRWGAPAAVVSGELRRGEAARTVRRAIGPREDGAWAVTGEGCPWARAIAFGWQDLAILNGSPQARRSFLDGFAGRLHGTHLAACARYRQILARRNRLLQTASGVGDIAARLEPWDEELARVGAEIVTRRRGALGALQASAGPLHPLLAGRAGTLRLEYRCSLGDEATAAAFLRALGARRGEEIRRGQTLVGPHRDDLLVEIDGRDMRSFGSRGQQRLLALVLRLAEAGPVQAAVGSPPVLLLDDALSELDPEVQGNVLRHVEAAGQVFLTTAGADLPLARASWWEVRGGAVSQRRPEAVRGAA